MKAIKIFCYGILTSIVMAIATGCSTQQTWSYHSNSYEHSTVINTGKKVAVLPFADDRSDTNNNMSLICFIPLMPYGWEDLSTPEGASAHLNSGIWVNFKPTEDFPKAVADDLGNTGLFSESYFSYQKEGSDYTIQGKILNTDYHGRIYTYCLSVYGVYLWFFCLPASTSENQLSLDLSLVDSKTAETLFSKTYTATPRKQTSLIYNMKSDFNYADMMKEVNLQFCNDIKPIVLNAAKTSTASTTSTNAAVPVKQP